MLGDLIECPCSLDSCHWGKEQRTGHIRSCSCPSCRGRRNRKKGRAAQTAMHRDLHGTGFSPAHEEARGAYSIEVQVESKEGEQVPANFTTAFRLEWTRRALDQADRAIAEGVQAYPAVYMKPPGGGRWLLVRIA